MSITLLHHPTSPNTLLLAVGYESGHVVVYSKDTGTGSTTTTPKSHMEKWQIVYSDQTHSQPVLSIALFDLPSSSVPPQNGSKTSRMTLLSTSADPLIAIHPLEEGGRKPICVLNTHRTGQQDVKVRSDKRGLFVTAGWDGRGRVYAASATASATGEVVKIKEVAVLKWQDSTGEKEREVGCYAVGFGEVLDGGGEGSRSRSEGNYGDGTVVGGRAGGGRGGGVVERRREEREARRHWVSAGGKDGRVSLWEIF